ncbi:AI-2E family transporter [Beijerinckia indica]|uniref:AI-2E family transporter n=1 Tax=Beijerinckia indica subsp. indica (strain ATCC 9039 / DSM 1715 / NCIMB 8712) TaxID=395963 RepID=B2IL19_BEII9|nr:AI-2E family transporter [Beijerinckia indica]ACB96559.1 protein of unknown function UPF0118 [Beijerinckia indica subsp. indica ATCC 9039]
MTSSREGVTPNAQAGAKELPDTADQNILPAQDPNTVLLAGLFLIAALSGAYVAAEVVLPLIFAIVLKLLLQPGMRFLERYYIPRHLAAFFLILAVLGAILGIGAAVSGPSKAWFEHLSEGLPLLRERLLFLSHPFELLDTLRNKMDGMGHSGQLSVSLAKSLSESLQETLLRTTRHFASGLFEMILILFFLLVFGDMFLRRLVEILPRFKDKRQVVDLSQQIESNISAYLLTITIMNAAVGLATAIVMWACGVGDPILWGLIAFLLNFLPIMGPFFGVGVFLVAGLLTIPQLWLALLPAGLYLLIHIMEGELITPMLLARRFTLNPVLVIVSLIFWFWMWGVLGAILSVPLLAMTKIICDGIKPLNAVGHFLEGDSP